MDIQYLLWLQALRNSLPPVVEQVFVVISAIAASTALVVLPCLLYWCINKRAGQFLVFTFSIGAFCNQLIKNTVCCYRPWIRSAEVLPAKGALAEATGYSFPSGHTQASTDLIGATGYFFRKRLRVVNVLCWLFVVAVAFSRNFLGVHTPQDVVVGLVEGILVMLLVGPLLDWIDGGRNRDVAVLVLTLIAFGAYIAYITLKPYPMDYDSAGTLLVDPVKMQVDCYKSAGVLFGAIVGWFCERRILDFEVDPHAPISRKLVRIVVGLAIVVVLHLAPRVLLLINLDTRWYELIKNALTILAASFVAPAAFCAIERRGNKSAGRKGGKQKGGKHFK